MEKIRIDLSSYKSGKSTIFTGRPQGEAVREELKLDDIDSNINLEVIFTLPDDTTSFNPSFYLGLLFKSFQTLGLESFELKYTFEFETTDESTKKVLISNLDDGKRYAINSLNLNSSYKSIFSKKK